MRGTVVATAMLLAACAGAGSSTAAPTTPPTAPARATAPTTTTAAASTTVATMSVAPSVAIGAPAPVDSGATALTMTVLGVVDPAPTNATFGPDPGTRIVAVQVRIVNTGGAIYDDFLGNGATLIDSGDEQHPTELVPTTLGPGLGSVWLLAGDWREGWLTFAVPDGVRPSTFQWTADSGFGSPTADWDLMLPPVDPEPAAALVAPSIPVGTAARLNGREVTVDATVTGVVDPAPPSRSRVPADGSHFVAVRVTLTNAGAGAYDDSPTNGMTLIDDRGYEYGATVAGTTVGEGFGGSVSMPPGDTRAGFVTFELPDTARPFKLQMALDSGFATEVGEFALA